MATNTRWYENFVEFKCKSCDNELKGIVYKDSFNPSTKVDVEPCQRCLQCAEAEIEHTKGQANELAKRLIDRMQLVKQLNEQISELRLRIEQQYVHYEGRRAKSRGDWEKYNESF